METTGFWAHVRVFGRELYVGTNSAPFVEALQQILTLKKSVRVKGRWETERTPLYGIKRSADGSRMELITLSGFIQAVLDNAALHNVAVRVEERSRVSGNGLVDSPLTNTIMMKPIELPRLSEYYDDLRDWQQEAIPLVCNFRFGQIKASTGAGKSFFVALLAQLAVGVRMCVTTGELADLDNLYRAILERTSDVIMVNGTNAKQAAKYRIVCCAARSLHHVGDIDFDMLIGDEVHAMAGPSFRQSMWKIKAPRAFGFSANVNERADKQDLAVQGIFGPCILERTYEQNMAAGDVVPIYYRFIHTSCSNEVKSSRPDIRKKAIIVANDNRNREFADVTRHYMEQGHQVLVICDEVEHVIRMWHLLPEALGVYRDVSDTVVKRLTKLKMWNDRYPRAYSTSQLRAAQERFASGEQRLAIANSVWHKGKDFPGLGVVIRLDGRATKTAATQIGGRLSRKGTAYGIIVDGLDDFDTTAEHNSKERGKQYNACGYKPISELTQTQFDSQKNGGST